MGRVYYARPNLRHNMELLEIIKQFNINGDIESVEPFGEGHINDTYLVTCKNCEIKYVFQRLNTSVFPNYKGVMDNIHLLTSYLRKIIEKEGGDPERETMTLVLTKDGQNHLFIDGSCYRMSLLIRNTKTYQTVENEGLFQSSGYAFGKFIARLDDFDASQLVEVIPNFHDTVDRCKKFEEAMCDNKAGRIDNVLPELAFVEYRKDFMKKIVSSLNKKEIPLRVTHNDTKLNNILMDADTDEAVCVIDLDTIMPGSLLYDFGDSVRFGCSTAKEDEKDLSKVHFDLNLYDIFTKGFLEGIGDKITKKEVMMLHIGAIMMTLECGTRFLTDYLNGDTYFKTAYPDHNLVRARTQFRLVEEMEKNVENMINIANKYYKN